MPFVAKRKLRQTWRQAVAARVDPRTDLLVRFDALVAEGREEAEAAFAVLEAAGLLWLVDEPGAAQQSPSLSEEVPAM